MNRLYAGLVSAALIFAASPSFAGEIACETFSSSNPVDHNVPAYEATAFEARATTLLAGVLPARHDRTIAPSDRQVGISDDTR